jgi:hypothetical protein
MRIDNNIWIMIGLEKAKPKTRKKEKTRNKEK